MGLLGLLALPGWFVPILTMISLILIFVEKSLNKKIK